MSEPTHNTLSLKAGRNLRILAIDVGMGTQDILLYEDSKNPENNIKMVFPSATQLMAKRVKNSDRDLFIQGFTMGGGPFSFAVKKHIKRGRRVVMTESSAISLRDDLDQVKKMGIEVVPDGTAPSDSFEVIETRDFDLEHLKSVLEGIGEDFDFDYIGIAVQDHGRAPKGVSDRRFRFEKIEELIKGGAKMQSLGFFNPPKHFSRMRGAKKTLERFFKDKGFFVDSKIAAIDGALRGISERPAISLDIGNGHTMGALVDENDIVLGMFEHHTGLLDQKKLETLISKFAEGRLTNDDVYKDRGHGCYLREGVGMENVKRIMVTGPKRGLLKGSKLPVLEANPAGDVMMTGTTGIVDMVRYLSK